MFGARYFGRRYFGPRYWGEHGRSAGGSSVDLRVGLRTYLLTSSLLSTMLTGTSGIRVRPGGFSMLDGMPGITYRVISDPRRHLLVGRQQTSLARVQIDCWSRTLSDCTALKLELERLLDGKAIASMGGIAVDWSKQADETDLHEGPQDGSDAWIYHIACIYHIKYRMAVNP